MHSSKSNLHGSASHLDGICSFAILMGYQMRGSMRGGSSRYISKYLTVIVVATVDSSHVEQTTFLLSYLNSNDDRYEVQ